jgi:hypothetical protein
MIELGYIPFYLDACMTFANALKHTMTEFGLTGAQSLTVDNLEKLLGAMPQEARSYFFNELKDAQYTVANPETLSPA